MACEAIEDTQDDNAAKLVTITAAAPAPDSLATVLADYGTTDTRKIACEAATAVGGAIDLAIEANEGLNSDNSDAYDALKADIDSQVVTNDFWTQNAAMMNFENTSGTLD